MSADGEPAPPGSASAIYGSDLAFIHHHGFSSFAESAAPELLDLIRRSGHSAGTVVDLGCGSGAWVRVLVDAGYDAIGVDGSLPMIEIARQQAPRPAFLVASIHQVPLPGCVAVTAIGEVVGYLPPGEDDVDLAALAARVHRALAPGGVFVFDVVERASAEPMRYQATRSGSGWEVATDVTEDADAGIVTRRIRTGRDVGGSVRTDLEIHRVRTFSRQSLLAAMRGSGFAVEFASSYGRVPLPPRRVAVIARKPRPGE